MDAQSSPAARVAVQLERLIGVAALYPPEHRRFEGAVEAFKDAAGAAAAGAGSLVLGMGPGGLAVQDRPAEPGCTAATRLGELLESLGVVSIRIHRNAAPEHLHRFARRFQRARHELQHVHGLRRFNFEDIPGAVQVSVQEFGEGPGSASRVRLNREQLEATLECALETLGALEVEEGRRRSCRTLLGQLFERVLAAPAAPAPPGGGAAAPVRKTEEVLERGAEAVRSAIRKSFSEEAGEGALVDLFRVAEESLLLTDDAGELELVREVLERAVAEVLANAEEDQEEAPAPDHELTISELRARISALRESGSPTDSCDLESPRERLAVLTRILIGYPAPRVLRGIRERLAGCLPRDPDHEEWPALHCAAQEILSREDLALLDRSLPLFLSTLRESGHMAVVAFLSELASEADPDDWDAIGPHVVNQILIGLDAGAAPGLEELHRRVAETSTETARGWLRRLTRFEAFRERRFAKEVFSPPLAALAPVFIAVMESDPESLVGSLLLSGFRDHPPAWAGAAALELLSEQDPEFPGFMARVVREVRADPPSPELRRQAARIIAKRLPDLPSARRSEPWVPRAVAALGGLEAEEARSALLRLRRERRRLLARAWPAESRRAASRVLRGILS